MGNTFGQTYSTLILTTFLILGAGYTGDISGLSTLDENSMTVFLNAWKFIYYSSIIFLIISLIPNIFFMYKKTI